jgi:hypothetical protein
MAEFIFIVIFTIVGVILLCLLDEIHTTECSIWTYIKTCIFSIIFLSMFVILIYNL